MPTTASLIGLSLIFLPILDFGDLGSVARLHEAVSIVVLPDRESAIFKGAFMIVDRICHELREFFQMMRYWIWLCACSSPEWSSGQCTCRLPMFDVCRRTGAKLQSSGVGGVGIEDTHRYFEPALIGGMQGDRETGACGMTWSDIKPRRQCRA